MDAETTDGLDPLDRQRRDFRGGGRRKHGLTIAEIEGWKDQFLLAGENALRSKPKDEEALKEEEIKKLKQKIGDLVMDMEILKEAVKPYRPFAQGTPEE